jgi:hypothetical protein
LHFWGFRRDVSAKKPLYRRRFWTNSLLGLTGKTFRRTGNFWIVSGNLTPQDLRIRKTRRMRLFGAHTQRGQLGNAKAKCVSTDRLQLLHLNEQIFGILLGWGSALRFTARSRFFRVCRAPVGKPPPETRTFCGTASRAWGLSGTPGAPARRLSRGKVFQEHPIRMPGIGKLTRIQGRQAFITNGS